MPGKEGRSGRPPRPIEQKRRLGITRSDRVPSLNTTVAIEPASGAPVPIVLDSIGRALWNEVTEAPWVSRLDLKLVETLCEMADISDAMIKVIDEDGLILSEPIVTPAGHVVGQKKVAHPLLRERLAILKHQLDLSTALGFSPVARSRLGLAEIKAAKSVLGELKAQIELG